MALIEYRIVIRHDEGWQECVPVLNSTVTKPGDLARAQQIKQRYVEVAKRRQDDSVKIVIQGRLIDDFRDIEGEGD